MVMEQQGENQIREEVTRKPRGLERQGKEITEGSDLEPNLKKIRLSEDKTKEGARATQKFRLENAPIDRAQLAALPGESATVGNLAEGESLLDAERTKNRIALIWKTLRENPPTKRKNRNAMVDGAERSTQN